MKNFPQSHLLAEVGRRMLQGPIRMVLRTPKNTSRLERKWRSLNKFRQTLMHLPPARFELHVYHIMDEMNMESVKKKRKVIDLT